MKTYAPVLTLTVLNVVLLLAVRGGWRSSSSPAADTSKGAFELFNEVVHLRAPLRRPKLQRELKSEAAVTPVSWTTSEGPSDLVVNADASGETAAPRQ
jgi:hypothetical protein